MQLEDKVALVVGASQGSGRAYVVALAREGAKVIAAARTLTKPSEPDSTSTLEGIAREAAREGLAVETIACDVERDADVRDMVERTVANHGRIDVVVFTVGIYQRHDALTITAEEWDRVMAVNVRGAYYVVRSVVPHMIAQGSGSIVLLTSACADTTGGASGHQDLLMYGISKAAVNRLNDMVRRRVPPSWNRCQCIQPRYDVDPDDASALSGEIRRAPQGRVWKYSDT